MFNNKNLVLEKYLRIVCNSFDRRIIKENHFNFRCNLCGDSAKSKNKMRGHLLLQKDFKTNQEFWYYKCWNNGCSACFSAWSAEKWLKKSFPSHYNQYVREILQNKDEDELKTQINSIKKKQQKINIQRNNKDEFNNFVPIMGTKLVCYKAIEYCKQRRIPKKYWKTWYVCDQGIFKNRLIIPFYNNKGNVYYYQGRSLDNREPKYLNKHDNKDKAIYNFYHVDKNKPIIVTEGIIDSLFIENSIAIIGLEINNNVLNTLNNMKCFYMFDNDTSGNLKARQFLKMGKTVFLWKKFCKDKNISSNTKDVNEIFLNYDWTDRLTWDGLKRYFTRNLYDLIYV